MPGGPGTGASQDRPADHRKSKSSPSAASSSLRSHGLACAFRPTQRSAAPLGRPTPQGPAPPLHAAGAHQSDASEAGKARGWASWGAPRIRAQARRQGQAGPGPSPIPHFPRRREQRRPPRGQFFQWLSCWGCYAGVGRWGGCLARVGRGQCVLATTLPEQWPGGRTPVGSRVGNPAIGHFRLGASGYGRATASTSGGCGGGCRSSLRGIRRGRGRRSRGGGT